MHRRKSASTWAVSGGGLRLTAVGGAGGEQGDFCLPLLTVGKGVPCSEVSVLGGVTVTSQQQYLRAALSRLTEHLAWARLWR